jgi:hypothetical protein
VSEISRKKIGEENEDVRDFVSLFGSPAADNQASIDAVSFPGTVSGRGSLRKIETREIKVAIVYGE